ncbi:MAG: SRPBCC domain-containing protein [Hyphomicrobium sp.]
MDAAPEMVFAAFADLRLVSRWLRPGPEVRLEVLSFEFRVGGAYRFAYHVADGQIMHVNGVFRAIEPPSGLIFSWNIEPPDEHAGVESEVRVAIASRGAGSELRIHHLNLSRPGAPKRHAEGWRGAVDQLSACLRAEGRAHGG